MGQPQGEPPKPPGSKRNLIITLTVVGVLVVAGAITWVTVGSSSGSDNVAAPLPSSTGVQPSPQAGIPSSVATSSSASSSGAPGQTQAETLGLFLRLRLMAYDLGGIMSRVCDDGKANNAAQNDLLKAAPYLQSRQAPDGPDRILWDQAQVSSGPDGGFNVQINGHNQSQKYTLMFLAFTDQPDPYWCGVSAVNN